MKLKCPECKQTESLFYQGEEHVGKKVITEYWCRDCDHIVLAVYKLAELKVIKEE